MNEEESFIVAISTVVSLHLRKAKYQAIATAITDNILINYILKNNNNSKVRYLKARFNMDSKMEAFIGSAFIQIFIDNRIFNLVYIDEFSSRLIPHPNTLDQLTKLALPTILDIPMLVPPIPWSLNNENYGGFILNERIQLPLIHLKSIDKHKIKLNEFVIEAVNKISHTPMRVNKLLLFEILSNPSLFLSLIKRPEYLYTLAIATIYSQFDCFYLFLSL